MFQPQIENVQNRGTFFGRSYVRLAPNNQVAQSLKSYGHFSDLGVTVTAMLNCSGKANTSIHGLSPATSSPEILPLSSSNGLAIWHGLPNVGHF